MKTIYRLSKRGFRMAFVLLSFMSLSFNTIAQGPPAGTGAWTQTFNEDFTAINMASDRKSFTTPSGNTWITTFFWGNGSIGDGSLNYYSGNNVSCDGNNLLLTVKNELAVGQHPFTGGLANTDPAVGGNFSQQYGYYELRVKISMTNGDASYAGLPPNSHAWPPEIEMFESPQAWSNGGKLVHFLSKLTGCDGAVIWDSGVDSFMPSSFHTVGLLWKSDVVIFYIDGVERGRTTCVSHEPSFLNIGHGCGSDGGSWNGDAYAGTWPQSTYFDYFRVWSQDGSGTKVFVTTGAPTAISGDNKIALSWLGSVSATSYNVKRSSTTGSGYTTIANVSLPYYLDNSVSNGTDYFYVITAVKTGAETGNSKEASATPATPTNGTKLIGFGTVSGETYGGWEGYRAYDGKTTTGFDYITPNGGQTGFDVGSGLSATLTKVRFYPRGGFEDRMVGGKFQASNDNNTFTDLYTISSLPAAGWNEVSTSSSAFRFFRYLAPNGGYGNVNEVEFYGTTSTAGDTQAPTAPTGLTSNSKTSTSINLTWTASTDNVGVVGYDVYNGSTKVNSSTITSTTFNVTALSPSTSYSFTVRARDAAGNVSVASATYTTTTNTASTLIKLTGTVFGTSPTWAAGREFDKAFDGNTATFFDFQSADGGYTGIDLGVNGTSTVSMIRFYPRAGYESRMVGGKFQGSNTSSSAGFTDIYTITPTPVTAWIEVNVTSTTYRYLRYLSPNGSYGNVAEIEFYGVASSPGVETELSRTGWITSASTTSNDGSGNAIDGNIGTRFSLNRGQASGQWWAVNFGSQKSLSRIQVDYSYWPQDFMRGYAIYTSSDGINWGAPIVTGTGINSSNTSITFPSMVSTQYLKIQLTQGASGNWFTISEFHAYTTTSSSARSAARVGRSEESLTFSEQDVHVYPIPASNTLNVKVVCTQAQNVDINVKDVLGNTLFNNSDKAKEGETIYSLDVSSFKRGIHLITILKGNRMIVKKIVIQ